MLQAQRDDAEALLRRILAEGVTDANRRRAMNLLGDEAPNA